MNLRVGDARRRRRRCRARNGATSPNKRSWSCTADDRSSRSGGCRSRRTYRSVAKRRGRALSLNHHTFFCLHPNPICACCSDVDRNRSRRSTPSSSSRSRGSRSKPPRARLCTTSSGKGLRHLCCQVSARYHLAVDSDGRGDRIRSGSGEVDYTFYSPLHSTMMSIVSASITDK